MTEATCPSLTRRLPWSPRQMNDATVSIQRANGRARERANLTLSIRPPPPVCRKRAARSSLLRPKVIPQRKAAPRDGRTDGRKRIRGRLGDQLEDGRTNGRRTGGVGTSHDASSTAIRGHGQGHRRRRSNCPLARRTSRWRGKGSWARGTRIGFVCGGALRYKMGGSEEGSQSGY